MPEAYREKARAQPFNPFPPFDHLHAGHLVDMPRARSIAKSGRRSGWRSWTRSASRARCFIRPPAWRRRISSIPIGPSMPRGRTTIGCTRPIYSTARAFAVLRCCRKPVLNPQAAAEELEPRGDQARHVRRSDAVEQFACAAAGYRRLIFRFMKPPTNSAAASRSTAACMAAWAWTGSIPTPRCMPSAIRLGQMISLASIVFNGVLERFPEDQVRFSRRRRRLVACSAWNVSTAPTIPM